MKKAETKQDPASRESLTKAKRRLASHKECEALALHILAQAQTYHPDPDEDRRIEPLSGPRQIMGSMPQFVYKGRCYALVVVDVGPDM